MRTLTADEIVTVGGANPLVGIFWGLVGGYIYQSMGEKEGIDNFVMSLSAPNKCHVCDKAY